MIILLLTLALFTTICVTYGIILGLKDKLSYRETVVAAQVDTIEALRTEVSELKGTLLVLQKPEIVTPKPAKKLRKKPAYK